MQQDFESWDLAPRALSPRSRLYAPAPEGIGTAFVESLASYVTRLAEAHAVSAADLVRRELSRHTSPPLVFYSHGINGLGESAARWVGHWERPPVVLTSAISRFCRLSISSLTGSSFVRFERGAQSAIRRSLLRGRPMSRYFGASNSSRHVRGIVGFSPLPAAAAANL